MARKPIEQPSTRSQAFLEGQRPLQLSDLTPEEKQSAFDAVSRHTMNTRSQLSALSTEEKLTHRSSMVRQKANKSKKALSPEEPEMSGAVNKPYNHEDAIKSHLDHFTESALHPRKGEVIHGVDFYSQNAAPIHKILEGHSVSPVTAFAATSKLSYKNTPENEKSSLKALLNSHEKGTVTYTPEMVNKVHSVIEGPHRISQEEIGKTVPFSQVHPQVAASLTDPRIRADVSHAVKGVDLENMALGGSRKNIAAAHGVLQTGKPLDPSTNPKFASYTLSHVEAPHVGSPEHQEYNMRAANIHDVLSGKVSADQGMFDFHGLRDVNEGHLSNTAPTPIDMHHRRMAYTQPAGHAYQASGDLTLSAKGNIAQGDKSITAAGIEHAVLQDTVHETAKRLQADNKLQYTVPSRMVNEASWANTRKMTGEDPDPITKEIKKDYPAAVREETARNKRQEKVPSLFTDKELAATQPTKAKGKK